MENCILPMEVLIDILARLPVKSLMRFKSVNTFFYSLIKSDNHFKRKHYEISRARSDYVIFKREIGLDPWPMRSEEVFGLVYKETDCDEIGFVDLLMPSSRIFDAYVKCADGLLCLVTCKTDIPGETNFYISIWNPSTRDIKELPHVKPPDKFDLFYGAVGLGFSYNDMSGKVVMIWVSPDPYNYIIPTVMVCSQTGNLWTWRQFSLFLPTIISMDKLNDFYLKGKYYWRCTFQDHNHEHLLWFDFTDEVFGKIELPPHPPGNYEDGPEITSWAVVSIMNENITLISYWDTEKHFEIWSMKEHNNIISWNKYANFYCGNAYWHPIRIWNLSRHLLVCSTKLNDEEGGDFVQHLISLDLVTQEKKVIYNIEWLNCLDSPFVYSESLIFF